MQIGLTIEAQAVMSKLRTFPREMLESVAVVMDDENEVTQGYIVATKLTSAGPKYLNRRTGTLGRSARRSKARITGNNVVSAIGSNVVYAGLHERGFKGKANVPAYMRKNKRGGRFSRNGSAPMSREQATTFFGKGGRAKAGVSKVSSGVAYVRAHTRQMNFPARKMFETGVRECLPKYSAGISAAVLKTWRSA